MLEHVSLENISLLTYGITFLIGLFICFTPCVYPVIPLIVGYLGGAKLKDKKEAFFRSLSYVLGMAGVYTVLGIFAALTGKLFGVIQHQEWVTLITANVFIGMGLFMLDVFTFPQATFVPAAGFGKGGAFVLGAFSGLVVGPCTTPVLGALLAYVGSKQNIWIGSSLLFTYALGMGFPLLLIGTFIGLLKKLPRSGAWMVRVKKIFGLLLIAGGEYILVGMH